MRWRQVQVVYKTPTHYEIGLVSTAKHTVEIVHHQSVSGVPGRRNRAVGGDRAAVLLWPRSACLVKRIQLPPVTGDKLLAAVRLELDGQLPFPVADTLVAVHRFADQAGPNAGAGLAFCVRARDIEATVADLQAVGVKVNQVLPATLALAHSLSPISGSCVHLEYRPADTEVVFMVNNCLTASVWIGEDEPAAIAAQVKLWWQGLQRAVAPAGVTLHMHGGSAALQQDLAERLRSSFAAVSPSATDTRGDYAGIMLAASRAAQWDGRADLELTPDEIRNAREKVRSKQRLAVWAGVAALGFVGLVSLGQLAVARQEAHSRQLSAQWQALAPDVKSETDVRKERDALMKQADAWAGVLEQRSNWPDILQRLNAAVPQGVWLTELRLEKAKTYQLSGNAVSSAAAALFVEQLRATGVWGDARLDLAKSVDTGQGALVSFVVGGRLAAKQ